MVPGTAFKNLLDSKSVGENTSASVNPLKAVLNPLIGVSLSLTIIYGVFSSIVMNVLSGNALIAALTPLIVLPLIAFKIGLLSQSGIISPSVTVSIFVAISPIFQLAIVLSN